MGELIGAPVQFGVCQGLRMEDGGWRMEDRRSSIFDLRSSIFGLRVSLTPDPWLEHHGDRVWKTLGLHFEEVMSARLARILGLSSVPFHQHLLLLHCRKWGMRVICAERRIGHRS